MKKNTTADFDENYGLNQIYSIPSINLDQEKQLVKQLENSRQTLCLTSLSSLFIMRNLLKLFSETIRTGKVSDKEFNVANNDSKKKRAILTLLPKVNKELSLLAAEMAEQHNPAKTCFAEIAEKGAKLIQTAQVRYRYLITLGKDFIKSAKLANGADMKEIQMLADKISAAHEDYFKRRNDLIIPFLKRIESVAKKHSHCGLKREEIINIGALGLIDAADKFDSERGTKFITYAYNWINQKVGRAVKYEVPLVYYPERWQKKYYEVQDAAKKYEVQFSRMPGSFEELAKFSGFSVKEIIDHFKKPTFHSFNKRVKNEDGEECEMIDLFPDERELPPSEFEE